MAGEELKVPIGVPVQTNAAEAADSVESLRDSISGSIADIKAMSGSLRQLRGTSDEVKAAKAALAGKIDLAKNSVSSATLALVKQGTSYDAAAAKEKKYAEQKAKLTAELKKSADAAKKDVETKAKDRTSAMSAAIGKAGGPVASLKSKLGELKAVMGESSSASGLLTLAAAGLVAAVAALVVGVVAGVVSLSKFILTSANAARSANLMREAWSGTAKNASALGDQIDALSNKVPTGKAALNDLAIALMKSKLGGQATVDAFNAVAQASSALGDEAGGKIKEFIERGRQVGRLRIDPREMLEGFGNLDFKDIAGALAKEMKISVGDATKALAEGRVKLADGAKAMRTAIEQKFGDLNLRKMMSFEVITEKLHEKLAGLTKGVSLEGLVKPMSDFGKLLDGSTVTGAMLKKLVTEFGTGMVTALTAGIPVAKAFFQGVVIGSLTAYIAFLKLKNATKGLFDSKALGEIDGMKLAIEGGTLAAYGLIAAIGLTAGVVAVAIAPFVLLAAAMTLPQKAGAAVVEWFKGIDWLAVGTAIPRGIYEGVKSGAGSLLEGMRGLASDTKKAFAKAIGFASPAKEFIPVGKSMPQGAEVGVEQGKPSLNQAVGDMVNVPRGGSGGNGGGGGGTPVELHVHIHTGGGGNAGASAAAIVKSPSFHAQLLKAVEDLLISQGIAVEPS